MNARQLRDLLDQGGDDLEVVFVNGGDNLDGVQRGVLVLADAIAIGCGVEGGTFTETECREPDDEPNAVCLFLKQREV